VQCCLFAFGYQGNLPNYNTIHLLFVIHSTDDWYIVAMAADDIYGGFNDYNQAFDVQV
jgi:hypothetical protein